ncbi:MAG TPA: protein-L-isoaspartate(D-aspartate) O-methyltransferase [Candidatus Limnocylindrales bacterium]|nr:protein-L-isoaspartate(D-aspartate) O-methyltransferase [Candidatus Limnocylindrales bacterium]
MSSNRNDSSHAGLNFEDARREMVARQIRGRGIASQPVLDAMTSVPRHLFVPSEHVLQAYEDEPLPIGEGQTISQPFMVAAMAEALQLGGSEHVLEIGAGSGYQAAVLSLLAGDVVAVELQHHLAESARERLTRLGYSNVHLEEGDGSLGWPAAAPFDAILVTAGAPAIPPPLIGQLKEGGRLVLPVGAAEHQELLRITRRQSGNRTEALYACRFVPLLGRHGWQPNAQEVSGG